MTKARLHWSFRGNENISGSGKEAEYRGEA